MKELKDIFNQKNVSDIIEDLKYKSVTIPSWSKLVNEYEPLKHEIVNDKKNRKDENYEDGSGHEAARSPIGLEKLLTKRTNEFTFAIPVKRIYTYTGTNEELCSEIQNSIELIYKNARINSENIKRGLQYYASCEVFTHWYTVKSPNRIYGFDSMYKLKCKTFSPMEGVKLYPLFDERGDLLAMSYEFKRKVKDNDVTFFETFTSDMHLMWKQNSDGDSVWEQIVNDQDLPIGKIPGVYLCRQFPVWHGLCSIRKDIEYTLARFSDSVAYNAAPVLMVSGSIEGNAHKEGGRRVVEVTEGGSVNYVAWSQSKEALQYHVDTMIKLYFMQSQMPDISFENMKSLGNIGYDSRKTLLADAHLKIGEESGPIVEALEREFNVIKAFLSQMNPVWREELDNITAEHVITPFVQEDEASEIDKWYKASGGKAIVSQLEAIKLLGISDDPQKTLDQIREEEQAKADMQIPSLFSMNE